MNFLQARTILIGAATLLNPSALLAQSDPMGLPASATQANQAQQQQQSTTSIQDSAPNAGDVGQIMKDKIFLRSATADGIAEAKFGQLAVQKSTSDDVKALGQKMVDDHTALDSEMAPIADSMGIRLPKEMNKTDQAEYDKLKEMSGADFDAAYLTFMVKAHHRAMRDFRLEEAGVSDSALRAAVVKGEGVIHEHLVLVNKLAREKGIPMPERGSKPSPPPTS
jgi:putative membrane protein